MRTKQALLVAFLGLFRLASAQNGTYVPTSVLNACPGYNAKNIKTSGASLTADLVLAGKACNVFGTDIQELSLQVVYETGAISVCFPKRTCPHGFCTFRNENSCENY